MNKKKNRAYYLFVLSRYIQNYRINFFFGAIINIVYKIVPVAVAFLVSYMVGAGITGRVYEVKTFFIITVVIIVLGCIFCFLDIYVYHDIAYQVLANLRNEAYKVIDKIAPGGMEGKQSGDIVNIVMRDINMLEIFYAHTLGQMITALIVPLSALIIMGNFSLYLSAAMVPFIIALICIPVVNSKKSNMQGQALAQEMGKLNASIVDGVQGLQDIISFRRQKEYLKTIFGINDSYNKFSLDYAIRAGKEVRLVDLIIGLANLTSKIIIISLVIASKIEAVWLLPLFMITGLIYGPLLEVMAVSNKFGIIFSSAERVFNLLQMKASVEDSGKIRYEDVNTKNLEIRFDNVHFKYPHTSEEENKSVLKGLSFELKSGESLALVGASGEGKSTAAKLLQRFWDIDEGKITINGTDIKSFSLETLRNLITVVPQDIYLFNRSIKENIRLAKQTASDTELEEALRKARLEDIRERFENGWDTIVGERAVRLSGGEKSRIALAQAFLKDSPILVLDEASANLDSENESKINEAVNTLKEGRAVLIIAHRLSTIKSAGRILLLHAGRIEAQGPFEELMSGSQYFRELIGKEYE